MEEISEQRYNRGEYDKAAGGDSVKGFTNYFGKGMRGYLN